MSCKPGSSIRAHPFSYLANSWTHCADVVVWLGILIYEVHTSHGGGAYSRAVLHEWYLPMYNGIYVVHVPYLIANQTAQNACVACVLFTMVVIYRWDQ